jgi:hypothetical protein
MKKIIFFVCIVISANYGFSQKKNVTAKSAKETPTLAKTDNLSAELKGKTFQVAIFENNKPIDGIVIKELTDEVKPTDVKLTSFLASGIKLYVLQWTEKTNTKTDVKTEDITTMYSVIFDVVSKKQVFSNFEKTNNIVEKVFLDRLKNASETQERVRREGFTLIINPDGTISQKNKSQENKWKYDAAKLEFVDAKKK